MARPGIVANLAGIVVSTAFAYTLGTLIYDMGGDAPEWAKFVSAQATAAVWFPWISLTGRLLVFSGRGRGRLHNQAGVTPI